MRESAAVIDIGSNSIKVLVAERRENGLLGALDFKTIDARISAGISRDTPKLSAEGMARGLSAVRQLLKDVEIHHPKKTLLVATSAVRDAANGSDFADQIFRSTGHHVRILSGEEEANYIGRGLVCDPALNSARDFYVFDLGGGSLECLTFRDRMIVQAISLPLGCVRLTERCVPEPTLAFSPADHSRVSGVVLGAVIASGFQFSLSPPAMAVGTGGTLATARAILAQRRGQTLATSDARLTVSELRELLSYVGGCDLSDRKRIPALPEGRADVFPTAIATVLCVAEAGSFDAYHNSLYNLRWGIADEALN